MSKGKPILDNDQSARFAKWIARLEQHSEAYRSAFGQLDEGALNWKPSAKDWSVGQCIDHVIVTNQIYKPIFDRVISGDRRKRLFERFTPAADFFGDFLLKIVSPTNARKTKTMPVFEPATSDVPADIVEQFASHQEVLIGWYRQLEDADLRQVVTSPASGAIIYRLEKVLEILPAHEERHFLQAGRLLRAYEEATGKRASTTGSRIP